MMITGGFWVLNCDRRLLGYFSPAHTTSAQMSHPPQRRLGRIGVSSLVEAVTSLTAGAIFGLVYERSGCHASGRLST